MVAGDDQTEESDQTCNYFVLGRGAFLCGKKAGKIVVGDGSASVNHLKQNHRFAVWRKSSTELINDFFNGAPELRLELPAHHFM